MTSVPSNLVPTRITQLPEYQGGSTLGYVPYVLSGVTYKVQMAQLDLGTVTSVNASGGTTGLTFSGGPITTSGTLTMAGTLAVANGGTGSVTAALARVALLPSYTGNALKRLTLNAGATDVEWVADGGGTVTSVAQSFTGGLISVAGSPITGAGTLALTVAGTSGGVPYFTGATTWATSAALAANSLVVGGGAGAAPATVTTGTGVVTALGVNTGSAGAFVVNGGALGTPSSGTATNLTGLPISSGVSGLGTGIATALAVNTGSAGAPVLFDGAGGTPSSMTATNLTGTASGLTAGTASAVAVGGITGLGTGVATALGVNTGSAGAFVVNGGALGTPSSGTATNLTGLPISSGVSGLGTGIATALAVNTGSAGAPVLFDGAGGTPSSMTATNLTGTASGLTAGTASAVAVGGITGLGTGVATALAVNTGSAGAFVVNGGALGTPSSGTVTNLTGTASININGTVGATTASTGAFTTTTATTSVSSGVASTTQGSLVLHNTSANSTTLKSSNSASAAYTITLPVAAGTNGQVLTTDGTGVTSWATASGTPITSTSANAFAVGRQGNTDPVLNVDASTASVVTGLNLKGAAAAGGMAMSVTSSGTNENLTIDAKGSGTITLNGTATGGITLSRATTMSSTATATAFIPSSSSVPTNGLYLPASNTVGFATNSGEKARIGSDGSLLVGTTTNSGAGVVRATGGFKTTTGSTVLTTSVATTIFTMSATGSYLVYAEDVGGSTAYGCTASVLYTPGGSSAVLVLAQTTPNNTISVSGANVQVTSSLATPTYRWTYILIPAQ
jgi:hypothetical protein